MLKAINIKNKLGIWLLALIPTLIYLSLCFNHNVWADESFTMNLIKSDFIGIITGTGGDVHPPLYYLIAKLAAVIFPTWEYRLIVQKVVVIIPMFLTYGLGGNWLIKKNMGWKSVLWFYLSMFSLPCLMEYAIQIRMYSWALFFVTMTGITAYELIEKSDRGKWALLTICSLLSGYTHYYALVACFMIYILVFIYYVVERRSKELLKWFLSGLSVAVGYLPWLIVLYNQIATISGNYWIPYIDRNVVIGYVEWTFGNAIPYVWLLVTALFVILGVYCIRNTIRYKEKEDIFANFCWLVPFMTMAFGVIVSRLTNPFYYNRYIVPSLGLLCLGVGIALRNVKIKNPIVLVALLVTIFLGVESYRENYEEEYLNPNVPKLEAFLKDNLEENDYIIYNFKLLDYCYEYYVKDQAQIEYIGDFDFSGDFDDVWFFYCERIPDYQTVTEDMLEKYDLSMDYVDEMGLEDTSFKVYHIYKNRGDR